MAWMTDPTAWLGLGTLVIMELVLGIDNLIFIAILNGRLPADERRRAVTIGLALALLTRLALLSGMSWLQSLTTPVLAIRGFAFSPRDLALIVDGLFLLSKGTIDLHGRLEPAPATTVHAGSGATFWQVIVH
jgi:predicted tellurium resistance membrane protein TerC